MLNKAYSEAAVDVLDILNHMEWNDFSRVSTSFIEFLEDNASKEYTSNLDYTKDITEMNLSPEAIGILSLMYKKFWCPEEKKSMFEISVQPKEEEFQKEIAKSYPREYLEKEDVSIDIDGQAVADDKALVVSDRDHPIFKKIVVLFKKFVDFLFEKEEE